MGACREQQRPVIVLARSDALTNTLFEEILGEDCDLEFFSSGEGLLEQVSRRVPDLVILSSELEDLTGEEVCRRLRAQTELQDLPILMVTARDERSSRLAAIRAGAEDFLPKPFDIEELEARVRSILKGARFQRISEAQAKFQVSAEMAACGLLLIECGTEITFANERAKRWLGLPDDLKSVDLAALDGRYRSEPEDVLAKLGELEEPADFVLVRPPSTEPGVYSVADRWRWLWCQARPIKGWRYGAVAVSLTDATNEVDSRNSLWSIKSVLNHKLNTPLNGIIGGLDILEGELEGRDAAVEECLAIVRESAERLNRTVRNLNLYFAAMEDDPRSIQTRMTDVRSAIEYRAGEAGVSYEVAQLPGDLRYARACIALELMESIAEELIQNSIKFHPEGHPNIRVEFMRVSEELAAVTFLDDGQAIDEKDMGMLLKPFYQSEAQLTGEIPGEGLGLSRVARILWGLGGDISLDNRGEVAGVSATVYLPVVDKTGMTRAPFAAAGASGI